MAWNYRDEALAAWWAVVASSVGAEKVPEDLRAAVLAKLTADKGPPSGVPSAPDN